VGGGVGAGFQLAFGVPLLLDYFGVVYYPVVFRVAEAVRFGLGFGLLVSLLALLVACVVCGLCAGCGWCVLFGLCVSGRCFA